MAQVELKTKVNDASVTDFIRAVPDEKRRADSWKALEIMQEITGEVAKMWGPSIVGFGTYHYKYDSGREGEMCKLGFSPRKNALTLYVITGTEKELEILNRLGKHTSSKACLYLKSLKDVQEDVLKELIKYSWDYMTARYG